SPRVMPRPYPPPRLSPYTTRFRSRQGVRGGRDRARWRQARYGGRVRRGAEVHDRGRRLVRRRQLRHVRTRVLATPALDVAERARSEEHTSELQSRVDLVCRLLLET